MDPAPMHPNDYELTFERGHGVGLKYTKLTNGCQAIDEVLEPAPGVHRQGILSQFISAGDLLLAIDGIPLKGKSKSDIKNVLMTKRDLNAVVFRFRAMPHSAKFRLVSGARLVLTNDVEQGLLATPCVAIVVQDLTTSITADLVTLQAPAIAMA